MSYQCPLCLLPLALDNRSFCCVNNHQFDLAKEGYVNLMPAHHKRSKDPGDNKLMTQARRRFLESNNYHKLRELVANICAMQLSHLPTPQLLDIGCGEGYYTSYIAEKLAIEQSKGQVYGLDISKIAIRYASKRYVNCEFSVASSHRLPFANHSLNAIVRIYAPCKAEEMHRVIKDDGIIITVTPGARHLYQLRETIYSEVRAHSEVTESIDGFELIDQKKLHYKMDLSGTEADDLLQMTPFAWKATDEMRTKLKSTQNYICEADFVISVFRKING